MSPAERFRSGFVALAGRPNSGKSSLLNAVVGENLAVVTPLPQTTRSRLKGIYNGAGVQIVFVDTPGIHAGKYALNRAMVRDAEEASHKGEADVVCFVVDLSRDFGPEEDAVAGLVARSGAAVVVAFNKKDLCPEPRTRIEAFRRRYPALATAPSVCISAVRPDTRDVFVKTVAPLLPEGPPHFPPDDLTDAGMRFFAAEFIRKHIILNTREEVPHATHVEVEQYREAPDWHLVEATIHVETIGQRGIVIGPQGALIAKIRRGAEADLSRLAGVPATVKCHVKVSPKWRDNPHFLRDKGYRVS